MSVEVVRKPKKPLPEMVAKVWAEEWAKEGKEVNWQRLMPPRGFGVLPRRWVVERWGEWDALGMMQQLGAIPLPEQSEEASPT